jgi:UDP-galactopyranose mutase
VRQSQLSLDCDLYVVGAGFFGATIARRAAEDLGCRVLIIEKRPHVGGNSYSEIDAGTGIEYHKYGTHIFHTSNEEVWRFVNRFTDFTNYRHRVFTRSNDRVYTMPINLATINKFFGQEFSPSQARAFIEAKIRQSAVTAPRNLEEKAISLVGRELYEAFIRGYTMKQWQKAPTELPEDIITRLPFRFNYSDFYFNDTYEGMPVDGFAALFARLLDHPGIAVLTGCDFFEVKAQLAGKPIVYTGPIDRFFDFRCGRLEWRTLDLELERVAVDDFQGTSVMNYADPDVPFTRIHEFRHLHPERRQRGDSTLIMREYSRFAAGRDEPYYPVATAQNKDVYDRYAALAGGLGNVLFGGRLGTYRYLDMHQAIAAALKAFDRDVPALLNRAGKAP